MRHKDLLIDTSTESEYWRNILREKGDDQLYTREWSTPVAPVAYSNLL